MRPVDSDLLVADTRRRAASSRRYSTGASNPYRPTIEAAAAATPDPRIHPRRQAT
jgi:hypothetical protein